MSTFWSAWISILTILSIIAITWLLFANRRTTQSPNETTGHSYDGIEEYDNPLPAWWFYMYIIFVVFSVGYLIAYPGLGSYDGLLDWSQVKQYEQRVEAAEERYGALFAKYSKMPVEEVIEHPQAVKMGQRLFANNCSTCHGTDARGSYGFPNLTDGDWLYGGSPAAIKTSISGGRNGQMPGWEGTLDRQQIHNVTGYVLSLSGQDIPEAQIQAGQSTFQTYCSSCHGTDGTGNKAMGAPDLTDDTWLYGGSRNLVRHSITKGRSGKMPAHEDMLSADKIHLLTAWVYQASP